MDLIKKLTGKNPSEYEPVAQSLVNNSDKELFASLVKQDDFLFGFIKDNVARRIQKACNKNNYLNLLEFFDYYSPSYDTMIAEVLHTFSGDELLPTIKEIYLNGNDSNKAYAVKYFSFVNKDKSIANVVYGREKTGFFKYARLLRKVRVGDVLDLRFDMKNAAGSNNRLNVAAATLHKGKVKDSDFYKRVGGHVRSNSKGTFFSIDFQGGSAYIPMQLMKEHKLSVGDNVVATAIYDYNKKRGEWGWRCISVHPAQKAEM